MDELIPGNWQFWGVALVVGLPLLVILLGEMAQRLPAWGLGHYAKLVDLIRNSTLLLLFAMILLRQVVGLPDTHLAVKIVDTLFWVTVLNAALVLVNAAVFDSGASDWRARAPRLLTDLGRIFLVAVGAALVISHVWKVDLTGLLAALGVGSLVIGLALQDTLSNLFSGITMVSARQFNVGDWIKVGDVEGQIRSISWRSVSVATGTGDLVDIPNSQISKERMRVYGADQGRVVVSCDLKFGYEYSPETVKEILVRVACATKGVLATPPPVARIKSYDDAAIVYSISFQVAQYQTAAGVRSEYLSTLWYVAGRQGLELAAPSAEPSGAVHRRAASDDGDISARLAQLGTFQRPQEALASLVADAKMERYRSGEILLAPGIRGDRAYVVVEGEAQAKTLRDGAEFVAHTFASGDLILFKSFFRSGDSPFTVRCSGDVEVISLSMTRIERALSQDARLAQQVERLLSARETTTARLLARSSGSGDRDPAEDQDRTKILQKLFQA